MDLIQILESLSVINRDNGTKFTQTDRLDSIAWLLSNSKYQKVNDCGLFHLYARKPVHELDQNVILVSSHVDCERSIHSCFSKVLDDVYLLGTYDNSITNAAIVSLMLSGQLPDQILVAFTGDEEEEQTGASDLVYFLEKNHLKVRHIFVLDVTDMGWHENADFTVENDFWEDDIGRTIVSVAEASGHTWQFIPEDPDEIPDFIPSVRVISEEAWEDESWKYDDFDLPCCSICLPVSGEMHSDAGVLVRAQSFSRYTEVLGTMLREIS